MPLPGRIEARDHSFKITGLKAVEFSIKNKDSFTDTVKAFFKGRAVGPSAKTAFFTAAGFDDPLAKEIRDAGHQCYRGKKISDVKARYCPTIKP